MGNTGVRSKDMTVGREWKVILSFAMPLIGSNLVNVAYTLADSVIIGNFVSAAAFGAVNTCGPILWLFSSIATGMGTGTSILVSQHFGAKRQQALRSSIWTASAFSLAVGLTLVLLTPLIARPILAGFMQVPAEMYADSHTYFIAYSAGMVFQTMYCVFSGILRAFGNSRAPLLILLLTALVNILLDVLLVIVFPMGVLGVALASVVAQATSALCGLLLVWRMLAGMGAAKADGPRLEMEQLRRILRLCVPVTLQMTIQAGGFILLQRFVNSFGVASIEGFAAMGKTEEIIHVPVYAFTMALTSFVGQNIGAGHAERVKRACRDTMLMTVGISLVLGAVMLALDTRILALYNITGESLRRGKEHMDLMCWLLPVFAVNQVAMGALQGVGQVRVTVISSTVELVSRLLITWLLMFTAASFRSIYWSSVPSWLLSCAISVVYLIRGSWKKDTLAAQP